MDKKRKAVYNPKADNKWIEDNKGHKRYLSARSSARSFINNRSTLEDLEELEGLIKNRKEEIKMVKTWNDYRGMAEGKYLANLGDYTLYLNDDKDIVRVLHENINRWQSEDAPRVFTILENELEGILYEIERYDNPMEFEDEDGAVWSEEDVKESAAIYLNEIFA